MKRRHAVTALALAALPAAVGAQPAAGHPIKLIVPYATGGSADILARLIQAEWGQAMGSSIVIENRAGSGGTLGVDVVAKAPPDGFTVGLQTVALAINPALMPKMPYDTLKDLAPIGMIAIAPYVLVVNNALPATNVQELIALAKRYPGRYMYGSAGVGSTFHIAAELFKAQAGVSIVHIPYRGGGPAMLDTIAGQVQLSFPVLAAALPQVQAGKLRALGVTGTKRSPLLPDVPTIAEAGLPGYSFESWFMLLAPAATPPAMVERLNAALTRALATPALTARLRQEGFEPIPSSPAQARARLERELPMWARLVKERGITAE